MIHLGISFIILVVLLILGVPVLYCFASSLLYAALTLGYTATGIFPTIYGKLSSVVLLSIPLFILAGKIMEHGKIGDALVGFIEMFVGKIKGCLAIITTVACAVFGAICGSGMATLSCIGSIMMPKMRDKRYPMEIAAAASILKALEIKGQCGMQIVSCPTCGRTKVALIPLVKQFEQAVREEGLDDYPIKVALMGCVVNGPGEAAEADIGIAGGIGEAALFKKGVICGKIQEKDIISVLIREIKEMKAGNQG